MKKKKHIVFLRFEVPLGNAVLATATLRSLRDADNDIEITAIASGHSLDLLQVSPHVDHILPAPNPIRSPLLAFIYALTKIWPQRHRFDAIILDAGNTRTLVTIFAFLTGIKSRIGYSVKPWLLHMPVSENENGSIIKKNNFVVESLLAFPLKIVEPATFFCSKDLLLFAPIFNRISDHRPRIVFVTETSKGHPNAWFADRFALLARSLIKEYDAFISFVGTAPDRGQIELIREQTASDSVSLAGQTSPRELAAFLACSDFCISVDTGAMHVARSVTLPSVILGNAAQPVSLWLPPSSLNYIELIRKDHLPCSICWKLHCSTRECMDEITVQDVLLAFSRLRERVPWGISARADRITNYCVSY
jgi:heptosyltransferase-2